MNSLEGDDFQRGIDLTDNFHFSLYEGLRFPGLRSLPFWDDISLYRYMLSLYQLTTHLYLLALWLDKGLHELGTVSFRLFIPLIFLVSHSKSIKFSCLFKPRSTSKVSVDRGSSKSTSRGRPPYFFQYIFPFCSGSCPGSSRYPKWRFGHFEYRENPGDEVALRIKRRSRAEWSFHHPLFSTPLSRVRLRVDSTWSLWACT